MSRVIAISVPKLPNVLEIVIIAIETSSFHEMEQEYIIYDIILPIL
jgi:hypothetical protein